MVVVGVTSHQGAWESQAQDDGAQVTRYSAQARDAQCRAPQCAASAAENECTQ
jgi:hypothetical protein